MTPTILQAHPLAGLFPMIEGAEYEALKTDIQENGLREPITLDQDGAIIDGRNRYRACLDAEIEPRFEKWDGNGSALAFILSRNLRRRHLDASQRAALAVDLLPILEREARGRQGHRSDIQGKIPESGQARDHAAEKVQVDPTYVSRAAKIQREDPQLFNAIRAGTVTIQQAGAELKERAREVIREQNSQLVDGVVDPLSLRETYPTIVIDPPWDHGEEGDKNPFSGRAKPTYSVMSTEQIAKLPVGELAIGNAHLYLWITNRSLPKGFGLIEQWGFRYITMLTWVKPCFGLGNYFRGSTEHVLFGVRGSLPLLRNDVPTHFFGERTTHSTKPPEFYQLVQTCSPGPWLELFQRQARPGWRGWGAEVDAAVVTPTSTMTKPAGGP